MVDGRFKETEIDLIPEDWKVKKIGDICNIRRGASPRPIHDYISTTGIPWVKIADATAQHSRYIEWTKELISEEGRKKTVIVKPGDLILSNSATPGLPKFLKIDAAIHDGWLLLDPKVGFDKNFIYYMLVNERPRLVGIADGSVFRNLKTDIVRNHEIALPSSDIQSKIGNILVNFDNKIEINQKMNQTLEEIGQAIFKHWFVHFEFPNDEGKSYKSSGGEMVDSELGEIPKGWEVGNVNSLISITSGKRPKEKFEDKKGDFKIPLIGASSLMGFVKETLYDEPILVIGRVGTHGVVQKVMPPSHPSDNTLVIRSEFYEFVYQILTRIDYDSLNVGTTQPLITQKSIKNHEIIIPSSDILLKFEKIASSLFLKINQNNLEIETLSKIRDFILPKLMSGKIRVPLEEK